MQTGEHHDATEQHLAEDSKHQEHRQTNDSRASRTDSKGCQRRNDDAQRHDTREQPVELLDCRMRSRYVNELFFIARWPIHTAKARTREPHE